MLRITRDSEEIIVREMPVAQWVNSAVVAAILFFITLLLVASGADLSTLAWSFCLFAPIIGFLIYLLNYSSVTIKINKPGKTVSVRKRSLFKYDFKVYSFNQIADLVCVSEVSSDFNTNYQLSLPLKEAPQQIELLSQIRKNKAKYSEAAQLMNEYIFDASKQITGETAVSGDER